MKILRTFNSLFLCAAAALIASCTSDAASSTTQDDSNGGKVRIETRGFSAAASQSTQIFVFKSNNPYNFNHRVLQITRPEEGKLEMPMPAGNWDLALVTTDTGAGMERVLAPNVNQPRAGQKMLELTPTGGVLPNAPELALGVVRNQSVQPNIMNTAPDTELHHNVAKVSVTIKDPRGYNTAGTHKVILSNVPTTLDWNGALMPNKDNPAVGKMEGYFAISGPSDGAQTCSTVEFIVPAHKASSPTDVPTNKLSVQVVLTTTAGTYMSPVRVIDAYSPQPNMRLHVELLVSGELNVAADLLPWNDETAEDMELYNPNVTLSVEKASVTMQTRVEMDVTATSYGSSVTPRVSVYNSTWLSAGIGGTAPSNYVVLSTMADTYNGVPRTDYVSVTVENFTKKIPVTQVHTELTTQTIVLSPAHPDFTRNFNVSNLESWRVSRGFLDNVSGSVPYMVGEIKNANITGYLDGNAITPFNVTRKVPGPNTPPVTVEQMCATDTIFVHYTNTLALYKFIVKNLYMRSDDIRVSSVKDPSRMDTTVYVNPIEIYGGSREFYVVDKPSWVLEGPTLEIVGGEPKMKIKVSRQPNDDIRQGVITFGHVDDTSYTLEVPIRQEFFTDIPPFKFMVIRYTWLGNGSTNSGNNDVDIVVAIPRPENYEPDYNYSGKFFDYPYSYSSGASHKAVGWSLFRSVTLTGLDAGNTQTQVEDKNTLLVWGGDATGGQGETVLFKAPIFTPDFTTVDTDPYNYPKNIEIDVYAGWYTGNTTLSSNAFTSRYPELAGKAAPIRLTISTYEGGTMVKPSGNNTTTGWPSNVTKLFVTNFYNVGTTNPVTGEITNVPTPSDLSESTYSVIMENGWLNDPVNVFTKNVVIDRGASTTSNDDYRNEYTANDTTPSTGPPTNQGYTKIATISYNRWSRAASVKWHATEYTGSIVMPTRAALDNADDSENSNVPPKPKE
jgi:hypothetical protein